MKPEAIYINIEKLPRGNDYKISVSGVLHPTWRYVSFELEKEPTGTMPGMPSKTFRQGWIKIAKDPLSRGGHFLDYQTVERQENELVVNVRFKRGASIFFTEIPSPEMKEIFLPRIQERLKCTDNEEYARQLQMLVDDFDNDIEMDFLLSHGDGAVDRGRGGNGSYEP